MASVTVLETVVHGWDISQATGEAADIPDALAISRPWAFARQALPEAKRGDDFAADLGPRAARRPTSWWAFLGRKSL